jgi:hypothetical protein
MSQKKKKMLRSHVEPGNFLFELIFRVPVIQKMSYEPALNNAKAIYIYKFVWWIGKKTKFNMRVFKGNFFTL